MGGTTRVLRSAESYVSWPGLKLGAEATFLPADRLLNLGNRLGATAAFLPAPRIYVAKGLLESFEFIGSFFFSGLNTTSSIGGILKWTVLPEQEEWIALAAFVGLTGVDAFRGEFQGTCFEGGLLISKDYVRFKPYFGASMLLAQGRVAPALAAGSPQSGSLINTHFFLGSEWELPVNLTFQVDLIGLDPYFTLFIGKKF